ncbi:hypothetical protein [Cesiribacter sp. SM1]|uniref:hypothetical protein n=1 Tax=Cesiribacter sp. SM1 TaxID=2861196 RepID=UPI001CD39BB1|nr:hypothetical protein [Cesiribacter sp. SM1]
MTEIKHTFYLKSKKEQNHIQLMISSVATAVNIGVLLVSYLLGFYLLSIFFIALTLTVIAPFFDTPSLVRNGKLFYYSPLFLAENEKRGVITVHGGTLFDYVFVINRKLNGKQRTRLIIRSYLDGLLQLLEEHREENSKDIKIKGTSYVLNERTASKIGLKRTRTSFSQALLLIFNYVHLIISYSFSKARLSFPSLANINTYEAEIGELQTRKAYLIKLRDSLASASNSSSSMSNAGRG